MQSKVHWPSALQLGFSLLGFLILSGFSFLLFLGGAAQVFFQGISVTEALQFFLMSAGVALMGALLLPSALHSFNRLTGRTPSRYFRLPGMLRPTLLIFSMPIILLFGHWVARQESVSWLLLPLLHVLGVGLPVLWLVALSLRDLPHSSGQRTWGVFGTGLILAPALTFILELLVIIFLIIAWSVWVYTQPDLINELMRLGQQMEALRTSPEAILQLLEPYMSRPGVILAAFGFFGAVVPLIEELLKTMGVWLMGNRNLSEAEGFKLGILSGAGFALAESLALSSTGSEWALSVFARIGTGIIHILNTGLMGWALARAFGKRDYIRLGASYLLVVLIHGLWNSLSISLIFENQARDQISALNLGVFNSFGTLVPYALVFLALLGLIALLRLNRILAHKSASKFDDPDTPITDVV